MNDFELLVMRVPSPVVMVHGGAGSYLKTTTRAQRIARGDALERAARRGMAAMIPHGGRGAILEAAGELETDPRFNAGRGARLQRDGRCRLSAAMMDGRRHRLSAVYNVADCLHPTQLAAALQDRGDRNLDSEAARTLMRDLGIAPTDVRTPANIARWRALVSAQGPGGRPIADPESAIGDADDTALLAAHRAGAPIPDDLAGPAADAYPATLPPEDRRHGTVGVVALDTDGGLWAATSTGGRGHETPGRISDSPTPAGTYACEAVALSATGFGEQILDLNLGGRIATRVLDGMGLEAALRRTFEEVVRHRALLGVIALTAEGELGYAYSTEACGIAWIDATGRVGRDRHSRAEDD